jgi:asparagine synthase (glutamine-hydrolysing)
VCGLAGIFAYDGRPIELQGLISKREAMHSRGPDGAGLWSEQESGRVFTHRRSAILDLTERGAQPMASADGQLKVVLHRRNLQPSRTAHVV